MADLTPIQKLVADHINATAEHQRLFNLEDWKLVDSETEAASLDPMDDALVALCAARPETDADRKLRRMYLESVDVPDRIEGCPGLTERVVKALIADGVAS